MEKQSNCGPSPWAALFLVLVLAAWGWCADTDAKNCFAIARLHYGGGGDWYSGPSMLVNLQARVQKDLQVKTCPEEKVVRLADPDLYRYPILFMTGHGQVTFSSEERRVLRMYLLRGGLLFADDNYGMSESFRKEMAGLFPHLPLQPLPTSHPIFRSHYDFPKGLPKIHQHDGKPATAYGITLDRRLLVLFTWESDLGNGWEDVGTHSDPPELHEQALRMGVNVVAHFLQGGLAP
jgi:Domain of unknown function (DUF4159)